MTESERASSIYPFEEVKGHVSDFRISGNDARKCEMFNPEDGYHFTLPLQIIFLGDTFTFVSYQYWTLRIDK